MVRFFITYEKHQESFSNIFDRADFTYMVPPFLAYYGVLTNNQTIVTEAYNQIMLYRKYLRDPDANNVWRHIDLGTGAADPGHWSTGMT